jgi:hypothetical protein
MNIMDTIHSLTELFHHAGSQYQIFDLGRRVQTIDTKQFQAVEAGQQPYPFPLQRHAHLAVAFWNPQHEQPEPWIWFLRLPLDERSLLIQGDMGNFIKFVIEATGANLQTEPSQEQQDKLANNPYIFKPKDDKMALFTSQLRVNLQQSSSQYYEHAQHYLTGSLGWNNWQTVGLQGFADVCCRLHQEQNNVLVRKALPHLPAEPLYAILGCLEHCDIAEKLALRVEERLIQESQQTNPDLFLMSALVRALAGADQKILQSAITLILSNQRFSHPEILVAIVGRCWTALQDQATATTFLLRLAQTGDQNLFNQIFADLVMQPILRMTMLYLIHSDADPKLAGALEALQNNTKQVQ